MKRVSISKIVEKPVSGEWGNEAESESDGIPVIRNTNFSDDGRIDLHDVAFREIPDRKIEKKRLKPGDIIIEKSGGSKNQPVGRVVYFDIDDGENYLFSNFTSAIRPKKEVEPKYVHYGLLHSYIRGGSELFQNKTTGIRNLQLKRYLDKVKIPLPSLTEQKAIVEKLDRAQRLIDIDREMLAKYDELIQSVFLEMFGDPVTNPKGWDKVKLKELTKINSGSTPSRKKPEYFGGKIPWVKTTEVSGRYIYESEETITELGLKESSCKLYPKDTILVAMYGQGKTRGNVGMLKLEATTNQACAAIYPSEKFKPDFLFNYLKLQYDELREMGRGGNQPNLNVGMVKDYEIILPPIEMQDKFLNISESIMKERAENKLILKKSEELFSSLVQGAFG
ncbi:restriction endonuclease subunit S [Gracilimonas sp.]|uniref:restriction endonuclease subunit S n=1 Tax=Gracilimonas sp. TaxID=1974203 RepID=UPI0032EE1779